MLQIKRRLVTLVKPLPRYLVLGDTQSKAITAQAYYAFRFSISISILLDLPRSYVGPGFHLWSPRLFDTSLALQMIDKLGDAMLLYNKLECGFLQNRTDTDRRISFSSSNPPGPR